MNTSKIIAAAALSLLAAAGAQAETYEGVLTVNSVVSRADVAAEARVAARAGNIYGESVNAGVAPVLNSGLDRATVRGEAVEAARQGNLYSEAGSYGYGLPATANGLVDRAAVRAEARAAARINVSL